MDQELFIRISKEFTALERKLAVSRAISSKINPVILLTYFLLLAADGFMYFNYSFSHGHPRSLWLSIGIVILIPIVLSSLRKGLRARLYPKAEAACTMTVPQWDPDRFADMDSILKEKVRLNQKYSTLVPVLPFLLSAPLLVGCYQYAASLPGRSAPEGSVLHLILMCVFYSIYGLLIFACNSDSLSSQLSAEAASAVRAHKKTQSDISGENHHTGKQDRSMAKKEGRLDEMVRKALRHDPPNFNLLYRAASQGSVDAIAKAGRALVPLIIEHYPKCWELKSDDNIRREHYDAMAQTFERYARPLAESGNDEAEFSLLAVRCFTGRMPFWTDLKEKTIPRLKELMTRDAIMRHWDNIPQQLLADMEQSVKLYESRSPVLDYPSDASPSGIDDPGLDAIEESLRRSGILPDTSYSTDM